MEIEEREFRKKNMGFEWKEGSESTTDERGKTNSSMVESDEKLKTHLKVCRANSRGLS